MNTFTKSASGKTEDTVQLNVRNFPLALNLALRAKALAKGISLRQFLIAVLQKEAEKK